MSLLFLVFEKEGSHPSEGTATQNTHTMLAEVKLIFIICSYLY